MLIDLKSSLKDFSFIRNGLRRLSRDRALRDIIILLPVVIAICWGLIFFDFFDSLLIWSRRYESYDLDQLLLAASVASLAIAWFSYRRWRDSLQANKRRKAIESDRNTLREQLVQTQKMKAIGELAGGIAHDFNNLLMVIDGYGRRAADNLDDTKTMEECLDHIISAGERGATLTRQLLVFSRRQIMERRVVTVQSLVEGIRGLLEHTLPEAYEIRFDIENPNSKIETDPNEFVQALLNLVINARDAMPSGGRIVISTQEVTAGSDDANWIRFDIRDTGEGMDDATKKRIFEPFFTTKGRFKGTGLGLAMVYGFVQGDGGRIEVSSTLGAGTDFSLFFRKTKSTISAVEKDGREIERGKGETVLLVEDNAALLGLLKTQLEELGYKVMAANGGFWALEIDEDFMGTIDVLLTDVIMPGMSGIELASALSETRPDMKVVFMSGYTDGPAKSGKLPEGATLLQKPVKIDRVAATLREKIEDFQEQQQAS